THCHLDFDVFDTDRALVMERVVEARVAKILNPGIDLPSSEGVLRIASEYSRVFAAVGVHPNSATTWEDETLGHLRLLASRPKVVAIGEIGLDYYRDRAPRLLQQRVLAWQLELAGELGLPVIIHNRLASEDILALLTDWQLDLRQTNPRLAERPGVLHSFSGDQELAERILQSGFYLGITGPVTFRNARELQGVAAWAPLDRLLLETDAPFLTPHPYRGQRNEPANVRLVAEKIAELRGVTFTEVAEITTANAKKLFIWRNTD
ncbi:MAG: TatD family hydrolase, partial [Anaerolineales bacterium]|nr:TatD family hydrolase [Anaerolineales bacterium]